MTSLKAWPPEVAAPGTGGPALARRDAGPAGSIKPIVELIDGF